MSQETSIVEKVIEPSFITNAQPIKKAQISIQELIDSLKTVADDVGQISELTSEEKLLVAEFFSSLLKLMQPWATAIPVSLSALPSEMANVLQANIDPTGHLAVSFQDGRFELINLNEPKNRDLMLAILEDVLPKFKLLSGSQKRKIENRIAFLSQITKEIQKIAAALSQ
jgi:hypothetical protein